MTAMKATVLRNLKEPCGTWPVIAQTLMVTIIMGSTHCMLMESTGITGKVITTLREKLRSKSDHWSFKDRVRCIMPT